MMLLLEAFDAPAADPAPPEGPSAEWLGGQAAGLAEGRAQALAEAQARQGALHEELAQSLADLAWTYAEARAEVLAGLRPLFAAVTSRLLPALAGASLGPWLAEMVAEAAREGSASLTVAVHPDRAAVVAPCLPPGVTLLPDSALGPHTARVAGASEHLLDLDACLRGIEAAFLPIFDDTARTRHG